MKKLLLVLAAVAFVGTAAAQKQDLRTKKVTFGPKVGLNIGEATTQGKSAGDFNGVNAGFQVGGFVEYRACKWFALSADVTYSNHGNMNETSLTSAGVTNTRKSTLTMHTLNVPILANFYVTKGLALKTGIQTGFILDANMKDTDNGDSKTANMRDQFSTVDLAIPVGISYTFKFGLVLDARYNIPLTNVLKKDMRTDNVNSVKNNVFCLSAGWKF